MVWSFAFRNATACDYQLAVRWIISVFCLALVLFGIGLSPAGFILVGAEFYIYRGHSVKTIVLGSWKFATTGRQLTKLEQHLIYDYPTNYPRMDDILLLLAVIFKGRNKQNSKIQRYDNNQEEKLTHSFHCLCEAETNTVTVSEKTKSTTKPGLRADWQHHIRSG